MRKTSVTITEEFVTQVADAAGADRRSVIKRIAGMKMRPLAAKRIDEALKAAGYEVKMQQL